MGIIATANVTFKNDSDMCVVVSEKPMLFLALDDLREKLAVESDHWYGEWLSVNIVITRTTNKD